MNKGGGGYIKFVAYLQVIGIILVVAGHSLHEYPDGAQGYTTLFSRLIYSFHMPLFMFVSGLLMTYTTRLATAPSTTPRAFLVNKLKRLILPFVVLTAVTFVPRAVAAPMADEPYPLTVNNFMSAFIYPLNMPIPYFWFLQASFILLTATFVTLYGVRCMGKHPGPAVLTLCAIFAALYISPVQFPDAFSLFRIKRLGVFFMLGCAYALYSGVMDRCFPWTKWWFTAVCMALWIATFAMFGGTPADILCAAAGIAMCISITKMMEERRWRLFDHLLGATSLIFLLSWYFNIASQQVLAHFVSLPWWLYSALSLISGIYIPWLAYRYLMRHPDSRWVKFTALLLGQSFSSKSR